MDGNLKGSSLVGYFGYGSLVNRETLRTDVVDCRPARLKGWLRHWQSRGRDVEPANGDDIALLTVREAAGASILGMLVIDRAEHLASVDAREARYDRVRLDHDAVELLGQGERGELPDELFLYVGQVQPEPELPPVLLQSYLDAVMAGFLTVHGEAGLEHFIATTHGFERPIIADRHQPRYPRAVRLDAGIAERFDAILASAGVRFA